MCFFCSAKYSTQARITQSKRKKVIRNIYIYPSNLKTKVKLRFRELLDIGILAVGALIFILALTQDLVFALSTLLVFFSPTTKNPAFSHRNLNKVFVLRINFCKAEI